MSSQTANAKGEFFYQDGAVPRSLLSTGRVYVSRAVSGYDGEPVGTVRFLRECSVEDARQWPTPPTLDANGFALENRPSSLNLADFDSDATILRNYYPECCEIVRKATGAKAVFAFDHNVRLSSVASWMSEAAGAVKPDATAASSAPKGKPLAHSPVGVVHADYSAASAVRRVRHLAEPPRANDTWTVNTSGAPLVPPDVADATGAPHLENSKSVVHKLPSPNGEHKRFQFVNVWRSIAPEPVVSMPLAMCDAPSVAFGDLATLEVRYSDRVGENYLAAPNPRHRWGFFPGMVPSEALLLKTWDSKSTVAAVAATQADSVLKGGSIPEVAGEEKKVGEGAADQWRSLRVGGNPDGLPAAFVLHSAFPVSGTPPDAPPRRSIEVRTVAFF